MSIICPRHKEEVFDFGECYQCRREREDCPVKWQPYEEIPERGRLVVCISIHWKNKFPGSMQIIGGEVEMPTGYATEWRCQTNDESGGGCYAWTEEEIDFWCYAEEFEVITAPIWPVKK